MPIFSSARRTPMAQIPTSFARSMSARSTRFPTTRWVRLPPRRSRRSSDGADPVATGGVVAVPFGTDHNMPGLQIEQLATNLIGPISFDVAAGECLALMGPWGVGKSLLFRAIVDLDPSTGNVRVGGRARDGMPARPMPRDLQACASTFTATAQIQVTLRAAVFTAAQKCSVRKEAQM